MKAVVQRVHRATVLVDGKAVGSCQKGLLVLVAAHRNDTDAEAKKTADRVCGLRIFNDSQDRINLALSDLPAPGGSVLAVSNFTIYGDTARNRRPSFSESAPYDEGKHLFEAFVNEMARLGCPVETGIFGAHMDVESVADGPVTVIVDVPPQKV